MNTTTSFAIDVITVTQMANEGDSPTVSAKWESYVARTQVRSGLRYNHLEESVHTCLHTYHD